VRAIFRTSTGRTLPETTTAGRFWLGRAGDEVIIGVKRTEPTPWLEIHCHGGREVVDYLMDLLREQGLTSCSWTTFLAGVETDPLRTAAAVALTQAATTRTASILLDQYHGALARIIDAIISTLDHGENARALDLLTRLAERSGLGLHLTTPWRVVVAGPPNVGKSSLINAMAGYQRSIVAPTPGTTRDVVTVSVALDGWPVELIDTAGLRIDAGPLEAEGITRARATIDDADLCLWLLDAGTAPVWPEPQTRPMRFVINKTDLTPAWDLGQASDALRVSARTGEGIPEVCTALARWLVPAPPPSSAAVPFTPALVDGINNACQMLHQGQVEQARRTMASLRSI
jgi:tRNA modification GTPase